MIGGIPLNFGKNFKLGKGDYFVVEGDEYDTAFFDKGPKFLHYGPHLVILTSIEFDHADIYQDLDHVIGNFRKLIKLIPKKGVLFANLDDPVVSKEMAHAACPITTYSLYGEGRWKGEDIAFREDGTFLKTFKAGQEYQHLSTPLFGHHNISNMLPCIALADHLGIPKKIVSQALQTFQGVKRRQEFKGEKRGILVIDDFAHHPTSVRETIKAVRQKFEGRRLVAVFEPRSNSSRRNIFQAEYAASFDDADLVLIPEPGNVEGIPLEERFSSKHLVDELRGRDVEANSFADPDLLLDHLTRVARPGDVVLFMSNGSFNNIQRRFLESMGRA
jgi:UDP-N-acetylmuramate: L-alanyl-gamma-D-glutamyl-meso-diaminopimelate ligase